MNHHEDFDRIRAAIEYIQAHFRQQPSLEEVAAAVHTSPFHLQRLFTEWAGVSPKKFLQFISLQHAKAMLASGTISLTSAALHTGLSGTGRLHDLFVQIEGMTPGEYKRAGEGLTIRYSFAASPFGHVLVASTEKGVCFMAFVDDDATALADMRSRFPKADFVEAVDDLQQAALRLFSGDAAPESIRLHLRGTPFQLKVWEMLLRIPMGGVSTYGALAKGIGNPKASRAVGTAVGDNPVSFIIPCHRVIRSTGIFGQYHWGASRKTAMLGWESARADAA